ncbi:MAG: hypothetical protein CL600_06055 [Alteromonas sp.]|jgi:hypothetical protein|uniref:DUF6488 family protein n=1 Tax=unclassified Alteromonas TaxID=2614992 RepID=UPI00090410EE|nr:MULTISPECIES: DUF6488 family protein [unclassified Alteromonas]APE06164.1 hypothetical protein BM528_10645 [Alteromonas sp. RW2A1]AUC88586.1 hypothetical protein CW735_10680 [Alteromonas sp. MB-3u-76]MAI64428.1 hypothetical protein [Alteromonas sp.]
MKKALTAAVLCCTLISGSTLAHGEHGVISGQNAISITAKYVKQMTFKDFGFEVGKLDESWKGLPSEKFSIVSVEEEFYVVSASNSEAAKQIFFKIANNGQLLDVNATNDF